MEQRGACRQHQLYAHRHQSTGVSLWWLPIAKASQPQARNRQASTSRTAEGTQMDHASRAQADAYTAHKRAHRRAMMWAEAFCCRTRTPKVFMPRSSSHAAWGSSVPPSTLCMARTAATCSTLPARAPARESCQLWTVLQAHAGLHSNAGQKMGSCHGCALLCLKHSLSGFLQGLQDLCQQQAAQAIHTAGVALACRCQSVHTHHTSSDTMELDP